MTEKREQDVTRRDERDSSLVQPPQPANGDTSTSPTCPVCDTCALVTWINAISGVSGIMCLACGAEWFEQEPKQPPSPVAVDPHVGPRERALRAPETPPSPSLSGLHALIDQWVAHKPFCSVAGQDARVGWRAGDSHVCDCGLKEWLEEAALAVYGAPQHEEHDQDDPRSRCGSAALEGQDLRVDAPTSDVPTLISEAELAAVDPGIRDVVRRLNEMGYTTTDSGDGVSKSKEAYESGCAMPWPHVIVATSTASLIASAGRLQSVLGSEWYVEATYNTNDGIASLLAVKGTPEQNYEQQQASLRTATASDTGTGRGINVLGGPGAVPVSVSKAARDEGEKELTLIEARDLLADCYERAATPHGPHPFLFDTMSLVQAKQVLAAIADILQSVTDLIAEWRTDAENAACTDGDTDKPCDGIQQCADDLEEVLGISPATARPTDGNSEER